MNRRLHQFVAVLLIVGLLVPTPAWSNPSHKSIEAILPVHGKEFSPELHKIASGLAETATTKLLTFLEKEQKKQVKSIQPEDLGNTHVIVFQFKRLGQQLELLGEPSGTELVMRSTSIHNHLNRLIGESQQYPATQKYVENFRQFIAKTQLAREKVVAELRKLIAQEKWTAAETELNRVYDRLGVGTCFLQPSENEAIFRPFIPVDGPIRNAMTQIRSAKAQEVLTAAVEQLLPKYPELIAELNNAVTAVGTTGATTWGGENVDGPALVERIGKKWRETEVAALQARAKYWALTKRSMPTGPAGITADGAETVDDKFMQDFAAFGAEVSKVLVRLVEADAARVSAEEAPARYVEYLRVLAPVSRQSNDAPFSFLLNAAARKVSAKNPAFDTQVNAYQAATVELLRWKARTAQAMIAKQSAEYVPLEKRFHDGTTCKPGEFGLFDILTTHQQTAHLIGSAPEILNATLPRLMQQKATVRDVMRLPGDSKAAIARYVDRTYANVPAPVNVTAELESLKLDLLVNDQSVPLTLAAMRAVTTAERGDFMAVGGELTGVYLESVITRFATLPVSAAIIVPLDTMPSERLSSNPITNMLMRFDLTPHWVGHEYFFLKL